MLFDDGKLRSFKNLILTCPFPQLKKLSKKFINNLKQHNISEVVFTDVSKDGMLAGINFSAIENIVKSNDISVITLGSETSGESTPKVGDILSVAVTDSGENGITGSKVGFHVVTSVTSTSEFSVKPGLPATTSDDNVSISIVARTQLPQSRCSQLSRDIFVYSFSLNPEDHQPSGTCNFSRIESAKFLLNSPGKISNIYALNYNVLRIMSGMGGLAYAI